MSKLRSVNTGFWDDEYIGDLSRDEQHLFLYFLTNPLTNMAGAYKIARKVIKSHTGFTDSELNTILGRFEIDDKAVYKDGWIVLTNWLKNQSLNDNMKKSVMSNISDAPPWVVEKVLGVIRGSLTLSKAFESLQSRILEIETLSKAARAFPKSESEIETETEKEVQEEEGETPRPPEIEEAFPESRWENPAVLYFEEIFGFKVGSQFATAVQSKVLNLGIWKALVDNKRAFADKKLDERKRVCHWILDEYDKRLKEQENGSSKIVNFREQRNTEAINERNVLADIRQRVTARNAGLLGTGAVDSGG